MRTDLPRMWEMLRRWLWLVVLGALVGAGAGFTLARAQTPIYTATAMLFVNQAQDPSGGTSYNDVLTNERLARTYGELIRQRQVLEQVIADLGLPEAYSRLVQRLDVRPVRETQLITLTIEHNDPHQAATIANAIARTFIGRLSAEQTSQLASTKDVLLRQIEEAEHQIRTTSEAIEQARQEREAPRLAVLQSELSQSQVRYAHLLRTQQEMALTEAKASTMVRLAEPAAVPHAPSRPSKTQWTVVAALFGLLLCLGAAFLVEYLNDAVRTPELVEQVSGLHTLGSLALLGRPTRWRFRRRAADEDAGRFIVTRDPQSIHSEAFRILRANVEFAQVDGSCRTLMVTSPNPGEGKSTVAVNLAAAMAQAGKRVLLVDADLRRPTVHHTLGLNNRQGLTTLLAREADPINVVQATDLPGFLMVMTSGPIPPNPAELLGSARMAQVLSEMQTLVDVIVFDAPPVLAVADPAVLSSRVDGVVVVVDASRTSVAALRRTREALGRAGANILGVVLNRLTEKSGTYYQNYYVSSVEPVEEPSIPREPIGRHPASAQAS